MRQILVELHKGTDQAVRGGERGAPVADEFMRHVQSLGYVVFHKESNTYGCEGKCIEYAFLKLGNDFGNLSA